MADYSRPPGIRFSYSGFDSVHPPDNQPAGKYPLAINARAYLRDGIAPRLPQSGNLLTNPLPALLHSLRRMDDISLTRTLAGPQLVGSGIDAGGGTTPWTNPGNITATDGNFATVVPGAGNFSDFLEGQNLGFAFSPLTIFTGILVEVKGFQTGANVNNFAVYLLKAGVVVTVIRATTLPTVNGFVFFGGAQDLWGVSWTAADLNNANFGVAMQGLDNFGGGASYNVDSVRVTIFGISPTAPAFTFVSGAVDKIFANANQVQAGMSGRRLGMVPFRPNTSVSPWMYIGDSVKMVKVRSDGTTFKVGIKEPVSTPSLALSGAGPLSGVVRYAAKYRSSATGAVSNPSPTGGLNSITAANNNISVSFTGSPDPQVDLVDIYRFDSGLLNYTYITTVPNSNPTFIDSLSDAAVANNPIMALDDFEPFPSIDQPRSGVLVIAAGPTDNVVSTTWQSGDQFNIRWLPGTVVFISRPTQTQPTTLQLWARPLSNTLMQCVVQPSGFALAPGTYNFTINQPQLAAQPLPALWGPTDNAAFMFACGDPLRPGTLYFTKGNNPDSAPSTNQIEITSPAEPLIGGAIVGGLGIVFSAERGWLLYPNFAQVTASILGISGNPFTAIESIADRGLYSKEGICTDGGGVLYFITKDGIRKSQGGSGSQSVTDDDLYNLFPHDGQPQQNYVIAGVTVSPPDYSQPDGMALRFSQGYVYFDFISLAGTRDTLVYDTINQGWTRDSYAVPASIHADNTGNVINPGPNVPIGELLGCTDGTIRQLSPTGSEVASMQIFCPGFDAGDTRAIKHYGDIYFETAAPATFSFALDLYTDRYTVHQAAAFSPLTIPAISDGTRRASIVDLLAGSGLYSLDIEPILSISVNAVGAVAYLWQPSVLPQPENTARRFNDWDMPVRGGGAAFVQGVIVEADTFNVPKVFNIQNGDDNTFNSLAEMGAGVAFNGRSKKAFSLLSPFISHSARLTPQDNNPWRFYSIEWIAVPYPELAQEWITEGVTHGLNGWQQVKEMNIAHLSTADLTLILTPDVGAPVTLTVPNSGGKQTKTLVIIPAFKFKVLAYSLSSTVPFRLFKEDVEVRVGAWGRSDTFALLKPFGGETAIEAQV